MAPPSSCLRNCPGQKRHCTQSCRGGTAWDKQHGVGVERRRLLARTREAVARGLLASNLWHSASHAEHARPMLQARADVPYAHL